VRRQRHRVDANPRSRRRPRAGSLGVGVRVAAFAPTGGSDGPGRRTRTTHANRDLHRGSELPERLQDHSVRSRHLGDRPFADQPCRLHDRTTSRSAMTTSSATIGSSWPRFVVAHSSTDPFPEDPEVGCVAGRQWVRRSRTGSVGRCVPGDFHGFLAIYRLVVEVLGRRR
jgi:hypothetical protein